MGWESSDVVRFDLGSLLQGQMRIAKLKSAYNSLINGLRGLNMKQTCFPGLNFPGISIHFILFILLVQGETTFLRP